MVESSSIGVTIGCQRPIIWFKFRSNWINWRYVYVSYANKETASSTSYFNWTSIGGTNGLNKTRTVIHNRKIRFIWLLFLLLFVFLLLLFYRLINSIHLCVSNDRFKDGLNISMTSQSKKIEQEEKLRLNTYNQELSFHHCYWTNIDWDNLCKRRLLISVRTQNGKKRNKSLTFYPRKEKKTFFLHSILNLKHLDLVIYNICHSGWFNFIRRYRLNKHRKCFFPHSNIWNQRISFFFRNDSWVFQVNIFPLCIEKFMWDPLNEHIFNLLWVFLILIMQTNPTHSFFFLNN